jgi:hypothetical protein
MTPPKATQARREAVSRLEIRDPSVKRWIGAILLYGERAGPIQNKAEARQACLRAGSTKTSRFITRERPSERAGKASQPRNERRSRGGEK